MNTIQRTIMTVTTALVMTAGAAHATLFSYTFNSGFGGGTTVADGNATGWTDSRAINNIPLDGGGGGSDQIVSVAVRLNLSGGYAGDLYGYLVLTDSTTHNSLGMSVLLNRVGTGSGSQPQFSFGYADPNLNIALSDTGANGNIHNYQDVIGYNSLITSGGAFQTDGGNLGALASQSGNNTWTLFLSDLSTGSVMTVNDWGLDIEVVPEPVTWAVIIFGALVGAVEVRRRYSRAKAA